MRERLTKFIALLLIAVSLASVNVSASTDVPKKVMTALNNAVDHNGRAIIIDQCGKKLYLFKRNCKTHKWELKDSFRCIVSKKFSTKKHYYLSRGYTDMEAFGTEDTSYEYGMHIGCYEATESTIIHSYPTVLTKNGWELKKGTSYCKFGISVCSEKAYKIWKYYGMATAVMFC